MSLSPEECDLILTNALEHFGATNQIYKAIEELGELQVELLKHLKGVRDNGEDILNELADVLIMINQMIKLFGNEECEQVADWKLTRLKGLMKYSPNNDQLTAIKYKIAQNTRDLSELIGH